MVVVGEVELFPHSPELSEQVQSLQQQAEGDAAQEQGEEEAEAALQEEAVQQGQWFLVQEVEANCSLSLPPLGSKPQA